MTWMQHPKAFMGNTQGILGDQPSGTLSEKTQGSPHQALALKSRDRELLLKQHMHQIETVLVTLDS